MRISLVKLQLQRNKVSFQFAPASKSITACVMVRRMKIRIQCKNVCTLVYFQIEIFLLCFNMLLRILTIRMGLLDVLVLAGPKTHSLSFFIQCEY